MRLPVEFAMFSAVIGSAMMVFGVGVAVYAHFFQGDPLIPLWTVEFAAAGLALLLLTAAVYFLRIVQFVRQRGVAYDPFFWNLPIESPDHPEDAGDLFGGLLSFLTNRRPGLLFVIAAVLAALRVALRNGALRPPLALDLGPVCNGGTHWSLGDVVVLGAGSTVAIFFVVFMFRRVWAMQRSAPTPNSRDRS